MLQDIFESKNDSAVLSFFLAGPRRAFSVPEIAKRLGLKPMKAVYALNRLVAEGLLKGFSKRGKKYFLLNSKFPLLADMRRRLKGFPQYKDELLEAIKRLGGVRAGFLSGIFCGQPNLPVDLLLVGKINLKQLADFLKVAERMMGLEINYSVMTVAEFELRRDTFDKFIKDIFDYPHLVVCDTLTKKKN